METAKCKLPALALMENLAPFSRVGSMPTSYNPCPTYPFPVTIPQPADAFLVKKRKVWPIKMEDPTEDNKESILQKFHQRYKKFELRS
jgi:hypothetical protein